MVDYLKGGVIRGTKEQRGKTLSPNVGGWKEIGRTTLGSAGDTISVSSLSDKRYYMILADKISSGEASSGIRFNNDSGSNYAYRASYNGAADGTGTSQTYFNYDPDDTYNSFLVGHITNNSSNEKLLIEHIVNQQATGAANAPSRGEGVGKWANTSNAINRIDYVNQNTGDFDTNSELVILGWDPDDTHTNNFWTELANVTLGSDGDTIDSGVFESKKYLWFQVSDKGTGTYRSKIRFNADSGNNYAQRSSVNGGADVTTVSVNDSDTFLAGSGVNSFFEGFVVNNATKEKLCILDQVAVPTAGATNAPNRREGVFKWTNTTDLINQIQIINDDTGDLGAGTRLVVWGAN